MPADANALEVSALGAQGDGIVGVGRHHRHLPGALPGDRVVEAPDGSLRVVQATGAGRRAQPLCSHVQACGGCKVQHMDDALYRGWKARLLPETLAQHGIAVEGVPLRLVPQGSRRRAVLTAGKRSGHVQLGFNAAGSHEIADLRDCAVLVPAIVAALPTLRQIASALLPDQGSNRLAVLAADNGLDVSFLEPVPRPSAAIRAAIARHATATAISRLVVAGEPILMKAAPEIAIGGTVVRPPPGAFLQAVGAAESALIADVLDGIGKAKRVADLFCGLGTFALALARHARVLAVDNDADLLAALDAAHRHASGLKPVLSRRRNLFTDPLHANELKGIDAVVLDPPRAGAKAQCEALTRSTVPAVVMVSCNPATLGRDLAILTGGGYRLQKLGAVDQFLFTPHLEATAVLRR